jgi:hypothetical protein
MSYRIFLYLYTQQKLVLPSKIPKTPSIDLGPRSGSTG